MFSDEVVPVAGHKPRVEADRPNQSVWPKLREHTRINHITAGSHLIMVGPSLQAATLSWLALFLSGREPLYIQCRPHACRLHV